MLSADSMRACRLVVDTGMHALGWSRQKAIDYMVENSPMAVGHVTAEIDRYAVTPGQALAYMIGRLEIQRMRREAEDYVDGKLAQFEISLRKILEDAQGTARSLAKTLDQVELGRVVSKDPALLADSFDAWAAVVPFVRGMLAAAAKTGGPQPNEALRLSKRDHASWVALIKRFRAGSSNKAFQKTLDEIEREFGRFVGQTAEQAVQTLQSGDKRK